MWFKTKIYDLAVRIVASEGAPRGRIGEEQYYTAMSKAYQNPAIQQYLDGREAQVKEVMVEQFINQQVENSHRTAGRLLEIQALRNRMKSCYTFKQKEVDKKSQPPRRRHSGIFVK